MIRKSKEKVDRKKIRDALEDLKQATIINLNKIHNSNRKY